jgi:endonuclease YncB( thermonuclease family)
MGKNPFLINIIIVLLFIPLLSIAQLKGKVVKIADGDTYTLLDSNNQQVKIRMHGIDCPEKVQPYGRVAKDFLSSLIFGKIVEAKVQDTDRYGRVVAITFFNGKNINEEMLKVGLTWHYKKYDSNPKWSDLEKKARKERVGLWKDTNPIAPWEWRNGKPITN